MNDTTKMLREIRQEIEDERTKALYSINPKDQNSILYDGAFHNGILKSLEIIDKHIANLQQ